MAIKKTIDIDVQTQKAQKNVEKLGDTVNDETKEIKGSLDGITGSLDNVTGGMVSKFKGLTGTLGSVAGGFKSIGVAIAASGLGLLVTVIAAVVSAFKSSEEGQNKFAKLMGVIGSVVGNVMDVFSDFGEVVIEAIENPSKTWDSFTNNLKKGYEFVKGQIIDRFKSSWTILSGGVEAGILKMRIAWNEFTGDSEEAEQLTAQLEDVQKEVLEATAVIQQRNLQIINGFNEAIDKVKEFAAEVKADAKRAQQIADARAAADKKERDLVIERARADRQVAEFREKAAAKELYHVQERIDFLEKASAIEQAITAKEIEAAVIRRDAKIAENALSKSTKEDLDEEANLRAKVIELETKSLTLKRSLTAQISAYNKEAEAQRQAELAAQEAQIQKEAEIERKRQESIQTIRDEYRTKIEDLEAEDEQARLDLEEERKIAELEALNASEQQKLEVRQYYDTLQTKLEKEQSDARIANAMAEKEAKAQIFDAQAGLAQKFGSLLQQMGEENKALAITGIIVEQVASVAKIISNTGIANAKAVAASPLTGGNPWVAINTVTAGLSIASSIASASKAISQLGGGGSVQGGGNDVGGGRTQAPSFNLVGSGGINQIAQSLNQNSNRPVKTYVLSKDVTSEQEFDRNIKQAASFG
jgi:hypothetical protein